MTLTPESIALLQGSREKEEKVRKILKTLAENRRIKITPKKVAAVLKGIPLSFLDLRFALSLIQNEQRKKEKNYLSLLSMKKEALCLTPESEERKELRKEKLLTRKSLSGDYEKAYNLLLRKKPVVDPETDPVGYLDRYLLLRSDFALYLGARKELRKNGRTEPSFIRIQREKENLYSRL